MKEKGVIKKCCNEMKYSRSVIKTVNDSENYYHR